MSGFEQVRRPREQIEIQLRTAITGGDFRNGDRLPSEAVLADDFGVSRTTVREALRTLAREGLVRKVPGAAGGSFVNAFDHHSLSDQMMDSVATILRMGTMSMSEILEVRGILEVPAAGFAAAHRTDDHLGLLRVCIDDVKDLELGDPRIAEIDARFHSLVAEASNNRMLGAFVRALHHAARPTEYLEFSESDGKETVLQHIAIVRALESADATVARNAMHDHLRYLQNVPVRPPHSAYLHRNPLTI